MLVSVTRSYSRGIGIPAGGVERAEGHEITRQETFAGELLELATTAAWHELYAPDVMDSAESGSANEYFSQPGTIEIPKPGH